MPFLILETAHCENAMQTLKDKTRHFISAKPCRMSETAYCSGAMTLARVREGWCGWNL